MSTSVQTRQVSEGGAIRSVASQPDARFGNTRKVTADNQAVRGAFVYDAFGTVTYSSRSPGLRNRHCGTWGYRDDGDTFASLSASAGLLHVGARYYDPTTGRFTTRDSILTEHPYVYCDGDPVNGVDPDGECAAALVVAAPIAFNPAGLVVIGAIVVGAAIAIGVAEMAKGGWQNIWPGDVPRGTGKREAEEMWKAGEISWDAYQKVKKFWEKKRKRTPKPPKQSGGSDIFIPLPSLSKREQ